MGLGDILSSIGTGISNTVKGVGDFVGLDGSFGYDGSWGNTWGNSSLPLASNGGTKSINIPEGVGGNSTGLGSILGSLSLPSSDTIKQYSPLLNIGTSLYGIYSADKIADRQQGLADKYYNLAMDEYNKGLMDEANARDNVNNIYDTAFRKKKTVY